MPVPPRIRLVKTGPDDLRPVVVRVKPEGRLNFLRERRLPLLIVCGCRTLHRSPAIESTPSSYLPRHASMIADLRLAAAMGKLLRDGARVRELLYSSPIHERKEDGPKGITKKPRYPEADPDAESDLYPAKCLSEREPNKHGADRYDLITNRKAARQGGFADSIRSSESSHGVCRNARANY